MSTTTIHTARKTRLCGSYPNSDKHNIEAGSLYLRHVTFPGDDGFEEIARPWTNEECVACAERGGDWIRSHYPVPARVGMRVLFDHDGRLGTIVSFAGGQLNVIFDGERGVSYLHPMWQVTYLDDAGHAIPIVEPQPVTTLNVDLGALAS